ncbi:hypothetical protein OBBRIDRAFT_815720 [Obba rivulosa]|uniref:Uncharacterized protein n=1 Tax=Obba rivulosa TaxID=1052685 RepID=A0A8E2AHW7_9APHY|nr:hypothetical protein OBBRIDRAFT_815720 [Obba rivulosa]
MRAAIILTDIDRHIAVVPPFSNLRRFPEGQNFKQWTGDDFKALMKVFLPAIVSYVPNKMVKVIATFLDFCYIARRNVHTDATLDALENALNHFHRHRTIFQTVGHSLVYYRKLIELFGAPNGLCLSITESKHIKAVKEPWRQMLQTNQRSDKLTAAHVDFKDRGMLEGSILASIGRLQEEFGDVPGPRVFNYVDLAWTYHEVFIILVSCLSRDVAVLSAQIKQPWLVELLSCFLYDQTYPYFPFNSENDDMEPDQFPIFCKKIYMYYSATAMYYAPSDPCGIGGIHHEHIQATPSWFPVVQVLLFCSFKYRYQKYPCTLVHWFKTIGDTPDDYTGMWIVKPEYINKDCKRPILLVIHINSIIRAAHLIPVFTDDLVLQEVESHNSLYAYALFYVSKYADHNAFETIF